MCSSSTEWCDFHSFIFEVKNKNRPRQPLIFHIFIFLYSSSSQFIRLHCFIVHQFIYSMLLKNFSHSNILVNITIYILLSECRVASNIEYSVINAVRCHESSAEYTYSVCIHQMKANRQTLSCYEYFQFFFFYYNLATWNANIIYGHFESGIQSFWYSTIAKEPVISI